MRALNGSCGIQIVIAHITCSLVVLAVKVYQRAGNITLHLIRVAM